MERVIYDDNLRQKIVANLDDFPVLETAKNGARRAAVAMVIVNAAEASSTCGISNVKPSEATFVLTIRAAGLHKHAGQWALPGGGMEEGEDPEETALRELREEVGLTLGRNAVLGRLDDFTTRSGFTITPVVMWGGKDPVFSKNWDEVAAIHRIPLREFRRSDAPLLHPVTESDNPVLYMPVGNSMIASPTGAIIYQFSEVALAGSCVRVAHFEQPPFAWR